MTYTFPKDFSDPVLALCALGEDPARQFEWMDYPAELGLTEEHIPELIRIVEDIEVFMPYDEDVDDDAPEFFSPIHAWRALGQLKAEEAVPTLIELLISNDDLDIDWVMDEIPTVMALIGSVFIPALDEYLSREDVSEMVVSGVSDALAEIGKTYPERRMDCIKALEAGLKKYRTNLRYVNATLIYFLTELHSTESDALIKQAYDADKVDLTLLGDYEDYQIDVGLIEKRRTPQRDYMAEEFEGVDKLREAIKATIKTNELFNLVDPDILKGNF